MPNNFTAKMNESMRSNAKRLDPRSNLVAGFRVRVERASERGRARGRNRVTVPQVRTEEETWSSLGNCTEEDGKGNGSVRVLRESAVDASRAFASSREIRGSRTVVMDTIS